MDKARKFGFTTTILHSDRQKAIEHGSLHKPIHTAVAYGYKDARELAEVSYLRTRVGDGLNEH